MKENAGFFQIDSFNFNWADQDLNSFQDKIRQSQVYLHSYISKQDKAFVDSKYQEYLALIPIQEKLSQIHQLSNQLNIDDIPVDNSIQTALYQNYRSAKTIFGKENVDIIQIVNSCFNHTYLTLKSFIETEKSDPEIILRIIKNPHLFTPDIYQALIKEYEGDEYVLPCAIRKAIRDSKSPKETIERDKKKFLSLLNNPLLDSFYLSRSEIRVIASDFDNPEAYLLKNQEYFKRKRKIVRPKIKPEERRVIRENENRERLINKTKIGKSDRKEVVIKPERHTPISPRQNFELIPESHPRYSEYLAATHPLLTRTSVREYFSQFLNAPEIIEEDIIVHDLLKEKYKSNPIFGINFIIAESVRRFHQNAAISIEKYIQIMTNKNPDSKKTLYEKYDNIPLPTFMSIFSQHFFEETVNVSALTKALDQESKKW